MTWHPSNAAQVVPRERIDGTLQGVDFGPMVYVIARADKPALLWLGGHSWSLNGRVRYSQSHLVLIKDRTRMDGWRNYRSIGPEGGRLTVVRLECVIADVCEVIDVQYWSGILHAATTNQTLLIEGGGMRMQPDKSLGRAAYESWIDEVHPRQLYDKV